LLTSKSVCRSKHLNCSICYIQSARHFGMSKSVVKIYLCKNVPSHSNCMDCVSRHDGLNHGSSMNCAELVMRLLTTRTLRFILVTGERMSPHPTYGLILSTSFWWLPLCCYVSMLCWFSFRFGPVFVTRLRLPWIFHYLCLFRICICCFLVWQLVRNFINSSSEWKCALIKFRVNFSCAVRSGFVLQFSFTLCR